MELLCLFSSHLVFSRPLYFLVHRNHVRLHRSVPPSHARPRRATARRSMNASDLLASEPHSVHEYHGTSRTGRPGELFCGELAPLGGPALWIPAERCRRKEKGLKSGSWVADKKGRRRPCVIRAAPLPLIRKDWPHPWPNTHTHTHFINAPIGVSRHMLTRAVRRRKGH